MTPIHIHYLQIFIHKISLFTYYEENDAQQDAYYKSQENLFSGPVAFFKNEFDLLGCDAVIWRKVTNVFEGCISSSSESKYKLCMQWARSKHTTSLTLMMGAVHSPKMYVYFYWTTTCHIPENRTICRRCCENLKFSVP